MNTSEKIRTHFRKDPSASPVKVAAKYGANASLVYKLRKETQNESDWATEISDLGAALTDLRMPKPVAETPVDTVLNTRAKDYGKFKDGASLMQGIKRLLAAHAAQHDKTFADDQWEAIEMIVHKMARIVNGNPDKVDSWQDIAGYATLVADRLQGNAR